MRGGDVVGDHTVVYASAGGRSCGGRFSVKRFSTCKEVWNRVNVAFLRIGGGVYQRYVQSAIIRRHERLMVA
jgi:hypothetical protein